MSKAVKFTVTGSQGGEAYTSFPPLTETETEMVYGDQLGIFVSK